MDLYSFRFDVTPSVGIEFLKDFLVARPERSFSVVEEGTTTGKLHVQGVYKAKDHEAFKKAVQRKIAPLYPRNSGSYSVGSEKRTAAFVGYFLKGKQGKGLDDVSVLHDSLDIDAKTWPDILSEYQKECKAFSKNSKSNLSNIIRYLEHGSIHPDYPEVLAAILDWYISNGKLIPSQSLLVSYARSYIFSKEQSQKVQFVNSILDRLKFL